MNTTHNSRAQEDVTTAADALRRGELVILPTETVYGLGADACNPEAVARIYAAKGRPPSNPLIIHVADLDTARRYAEVDETAEKLAAAFWPGPLTLVLPLKPGHGLAGNLSAGLETVAIRSPRHPLAQALLRAFDGPIAAPSANISGRISPTTAAAARAELGDKVPHIIDGGPSDQGLESTIIAIEPEAIELLRPGTITTAEIERVAGRPVRFTGPVVTSRPNAPGQLESHYAPRARIRLDADRAKPGEVLLGFGANAPEDALNLSATGNLEEAAANLFAMLRQLDDNGAEIIAVMPVPNHGVGLAINDRLRRAAAPRPGDPVT